MKTLTRVQPLYNDLQAAYEDVESTLAGAAGMSTRAAAHLRGITSLTAASGTLMRAIESDLLAAGPQAGKPTADLDSLRKQARLLANHIVALAANVKASKHQTSGWSAVTKDLEELFALVEGFERTLSAQPSTKVIEVSLHAARRRMWRVEARIARLGWPTDLARKWRDVREQLSAISDELGLPRVIDLAPADRAEQPPASGAAKKPTTRIYRGPR